MSCVTIEFVVCAPSTDKLLPWVYPKVDCRPAFVDIYRFGIPQTITTDQGTMFTSGEFDEFAFGIKVLNSSPYYAQANGQAEASKKEIIKLIK